MKNEMKKKETITPPEFANDVEIPVGLRGETNFEVKHITHIELPTLIRETEDGGKVYEGIPLREIQKQYKTAEETEIAETFELVSNIAETISELGGQAMLVGGFVRDTLMGYRPKDVDIEVYGITPDQLEDALEDFGRVEDVGKSFGILKLITSAGLDIDVSLPRTDSKIDVGHKGFAINVDPTMSIKEAARRRDFTFNTVAQDPVTGEIFDYFGGVEDACGRTLRVTDDKLFQDDPLRVMRGVQFTSRFGLKTENTTAALMREMVPQLEEIPFERMTTEWEKLLVKSPQPSIGLQMMANLGILEKFYPELDVLRQTPQEFDWHPEGNVWVHTLMVVDQARKIAYREGLTPEDSFDLIMGALTHDVGKATTTKYEEKKGVMRFTSHGHERSGYERAAQILSKFTLNKKRKEKILHMVTEHMMPGALYMHFTSEEAQRRGDNSKRAIRRLQKRIGNNTTIRDIALVGEADALGRGPFPDPDRPEQYQLLFSENARWMLKEAKKYKLEEKHTSIIRGLDLLEIPAFANLPQKARILFGEFIKLADRMHDTFDLGRPEILKLISSGSEVKDLEDILAELDSKVTDSEKEESVVEVEQRGYDIVEKQSDERETEQVFSVPKMFLSYMNVMLHARSIIKEDHSVQGVLSEVIPELTKVTDSDTIDFTELLPDIKDMTTFSDTIERLVSKGWRTSEIETYIELLKNEGISDISIVNQLLLASEESYIK